MPHCNKEMTGGTPGCMAGGKKKTQKKKKMNIFFAFKGKFEKENPKMFKGLSVTEKGKLAGKKYKEMKKKGTLGKYVGMKMKGGAGHEDAEAEADADDAGDAEDTESGAGADAGDGAGAGAGADDMSAEDMMKAMKGVTGDAGVPLEGDEAPALDGDGEEPAQEGGKRRRKKKTAKKGKKSAKKSKKSAKKSKKGKKSAKKSAKKSKK